MLRLLIVGCLLPLASPGQIRGGLKQIDDAGKAVAVRNDVAQPGEEVVTLRYFRIKKGTFDQFLKASTDGVWPYYEKIGARVIGMWKVVPPPDPEGQPVGEKDYDEVYLSTRYVSMAHWAATRDPVRMGGNGPDWERCKRGLDLRQSLTITLTVLFLKGQMGGPKPYYMPGLREEEKKQ